MSEQTTTSGREAARVTLPWRAWGAAVLTLAVFVGVVAVVSLQARARWRVQVLEREGEVLAAVTTMQRDVLAQEAGDLGLPVEDDPMLIALNTSKLRGVFAVRLFDVNGDFVDALPGEVAEATLPGSDLRMLQAGRPVVRFHPALDLSAIILGQEPGEKVALLEAAVPLRERDAVAGDGLHSVIQYWMSGALVASEFTRLDRELAMQAGAALLAGGVLIAGLLAWAFRRLARAQALLEARAGDLAAANRELAQAARSAAIGAITGHLMHGLRNPLAGLEGFVAAGAVGGASDDTGDWASARESTRRLRAIIEETLGVLRDVQDGAGYEMSAGEMCEEITARLSALCEARRVDLQVSGATEARLVARSAGVGGLALANVVQNAIEASPEGGCVAVTLVVGAAALEVTVRDEGPGLSEAVRADPFRPRRSGKPDGAGIGLALSRELARHAGGDLELVSSRPDGTAFRLRLPLAAVEVGQQA